MIATPKCGQRGLVHARLVHARHTDGAWPYAAGKPGNATILEARSYGETAAAPPRRRGLRVERGEAHRSPSSSRRHAAAEVGLLVLLLL